MGYAPTDQPGEVLHAAFNDWLHTTISSITHRQALLDIGGFDERERYAVDFDLWLRLARYNRFIATSEVTADWRWHGGQQSSAVREQLAAAYRFRRRFIDTLEAEGHRELASAFKLQFQGLWVADMARSVHRRDTDRLRIVESLAEFVPDLPLKRRLGWATYARLPTGAASWLWRMQVRGRAGL